MKIYKITTKDVKPHTSQLRFHITINDKSYEYVTQAINKTTINIACASIKKKDHDKCLARATLVPSVHLKTVKKEFIYRNSKTTKFEWAETNIETDYFDIKSYTIKDHTCAEMCLKGCILKHTCQGSNDKARDPDENSTLTVKVNSKLTVKVKNVKDLNKAVDAIKKQGLLLL